MISAASQHELHEFIRHLLSAVAGATLYTVNHPQVHRLAEAAHGSLARALAERPDIALLSVDGELIIDAEPQPFSLVLDRFVQVLREHGIGHLRFLAGVPRSEVDQLIAGLARQTAAEQLVSSEHIRLGQVELPGQGSEAGSLGSAGAGSAQTLKDLPPAELARMEEIYEAVKRKESLKPSGIATVVADLVEAFQREGAPLLLLAALREKDEYTFTHAANVCILTIAQAQSLGISGQALHDIGIAAMLHDVGKMFIPEEILCKPDRLTDDEFARMKQHPLLGARYLMESPGVPRLASIVAFEHHLRFDRSGYPSVSADWQQHVASQMTAIADCFDAMRTRRPYQPTRELKDIAGALVKGSGTEFNPLLVRNMLLLLSSLNRI